MGEQGDASPGRAQPAHSSTTSRGSAVGRRAGLSLPQQARDVQHTSRARPRARAGARRRRRWSRRRPARPSARRTRRSRGRGPSPARRVASTGAPSRDRAGSRTARSSAGRARAAHLPAHQLGDRAHRRQPPQAVDVGEAVARAGVEHQVEAAEPGPQPAAARGPSRTSARASPTASARHPGRRTGRSPRRPARPGARAHLVPSARARTPRLVDRSSAQRIRIRTAGHLSALARTRRRVPRADRRASRAPTRPAAAARTRGTAGSDGRPAGCRRVARPASSAASAGTAGCGRDRPRPAVRPRSRQR